MCYVRKQLDALYKYKNTGDELFCPYILWLEKRRFLVVKRRFLIVKRRFSGRKPPFSYLRGFITLFKSFASGCCWWSRLQGTP